MKLTDVATIISSRSRINIGDAYRLLKYFKYFEESYASKQLLTDVIMFLSNSGFDQIQVKKIIENEYNRSKNIESILKYKLNIDNIQKKFMDKPLNIKFGRNEESISRSGLLGREASKRFRALTEKLIKTQQFSPDPKMIPILPLVQTCKWTFKSKQCGYEGAGISCNCTYPACVELKNQENFGEFIPVEKGIKFTQGNMIDKVSGISLEEASDVAKKMAIDTRLKQIAVDFETSFLKGPSPTRSPDGIYYDTSKPASNADFMWTDQNSKEDETQEIPEGIPESDWNALSYSSQQIILKRMGYNKKDIKNKNRAIDL